MILIRIPIFESHDPQNSSETRSPIFPRLNHLMSAHSTWPWQVAAATPSASIATALHRLALIYSNTIVVAFDIYVAWLPLLYSDILVYLRPPITVSITVTRAEIFGMTTWTAWIIAPIIVIVKASIYWAFVVAQGDYALNIYKRWKDGLYSGYLRWNDEDCSEHYLQWTLWFIINTADQTRITA